MVIEQQNAQLIIQNMGIEKVHATLFEKEKGKQTDQTVLFLEGKSWHLTIEEAIQERQRLADEKKAKEATKERQKTAKNNKKERWERLEAWWKEVCEEYDQAVAAWEIQQAKLHVEGIRVAALPKKPKRPLKSMVAKLHNVEDEEDEDSNVEESWLLIDKHIHHWTIRSSHCVKDQNVWLTGPL